MTNIELQSFLVTSVLKRDGDTDFTVAQQLLNLAKREFQSMYDWGCQETHQNPVYAAVGITIDPTAIKRVDAVYVQATDDTTGLTVRGREITPQTREQVQGEGLDRFGHHHHGGERWWIQEDKLFINNDALIGVTLWIDQYIFLPDYSGSVTTDWFSVMAPLALIWKAAAMGSLVGWEDDRVGMFNAEADKQVMLARKVDVGNREGGTNPVLRAPMRGYRMCR
jgi:hypothetical protein